MSALQHSSSPLAQPASRNAPCPCGSGRRYKHCHGDQQDSATASAQRSAVALGETLAAALAAQQASDWPRAEALYRQALSTDPDNADALHMLGVVCLSGGRYRDALQLIGRAGELTGWRFPAFVRNYSLALATKLETKAARQDITARQAALAADRRRVAESRRGEPEPLVSVVIPSYNHAAYIGHAIASVAAQTYRNIELIVIDDGSRDGSPTVIEAALARCDLPHRFVARENRGAAATINEGIAMARGSYVNALNSDDAFPAERIACFIRDVHAAGGEWGFARCRYIGDTGATLPPDDARAGSLAMLVDDIAASSRRSTRFFRGNPAISTGNLFSATQLLRKFGGFSGHHYNHDWEFCLRASAESEPVFLPETLYDYRLHGSNTISGAGQRAVQEADQIISAAFAAATRDQSANPLALSRSLDPDLYLSIRAWHATLLNLSIDDMTDIAARLRSMPEDRPHDVDMLLGFSSAAGPTGRAATASTTPQLSPA